MVTLVYFSLVFCMVCLCCICLRCTWGCCCLCLFSCLSSLGVKLFTVVVGFVVYSYALGCFVSCLIIVYFASLCVV